MHLRKDLLLSNPPNQKPTPLAIQWLKLHFPNVGCEGSIPGQGAVETPMAHSQKI